MITVQPEGFQHDTRDLRQYGTPVHTVTMSHNGQTVHCQFHTAKDGSPFLVLRQNNGDFVHEVYINEDRQIEVTSPWADLQSFDGPVTL